MAKDWALSVPNSHLKDEDHLLEEFLRRYENPSSSILDVPVHPDTDYRAYQRQIVEAAWLLFEGIYAHLHFKEDLHAVAPLRRLGNLYESLSDPEGGPLSRLDFHREMTRIFVSVRDRHMNYGWPEDFKGHLAWVGFEVEECWEELRQGVFEELVNLEASGDSGFVEKQSLRQELRHKYVISRAHRALGERLKPGDEVLSWNGVPIAEAVGLSAARQPGSNPEASEALGLSRLTMVPIYKAEPPDAHSVRVDIRRNDEDRWRKVDWRVVQRPEEPLPDRPAASSLGALDLGIDDAEDELRALRGFLHANDESTGDDLTVKELEIVCTWPFRFTYLRIFGFPKKDPCSLLAELRRAVHGKAQSGLVVDIRDNPGGSIRLAELLLQALTPNDVEPEAFQFAATSLTKCLCDPEKEDVHPNLRRWQKWGESIRASTITGRYHSEALPITEKMMPFLYEPMIFYGPRVLITNARSYSAADMFAAGFQDNNLGKILGTHDNTGAGGANVVSYDDLQTIACHPGTTPRLGFRELDANGSGGMKVALRRSLRVGEREGEPLEGNGVVPDARHFVTERDVLTGNLDLKRRAAAMLMSKPLLFVDGNFEAHTWKLKLKLKNIDPDVDLEFYLLRQSHSGRGGLQPVHVPREGGLAGKWPDPGRLIEVATVDGPTPFDTDSRPADCSTPFHVDVTAAVVHLTNVPIRYPGLLIKAEVNDEVVGGWVLYR